MLLKFANELSIREDQITEIIKNPARYPMISVSSKEERLQHLFNLFRMIFADHQIDEQESNLIYKYVIGLGCSEKKAKDVIKKSVKIFSGNIEFEEYEYLVNKNG
ncbi:TerB family tellurite resistance protein [Aquimarina sp. M1]